VPDISVLEQFGPGQMGCGRLRLEPVSQTNWYLFNYTRSSFHIHIDENDAYSFEIIEPELMKEVLLST